VIPIYQLIKEVKAADNQNDVPVILVGNKCDEEDNRQVKTGKCEYRKTETFIFALVTMFAKTFVEKKRNN